MRYTSRAKQRSGEFWQDEAGSTLVEIAFVLPVFFLLLIGFIDFSLVLMGGCSATYASRAAARFASVGSTTSLHPCDSSMVATKAAAYLWVPGSNPVRVTTTWSPSNTVGGTVNVAISIQYPVGLPGFSLTQMKIGASAQRMIVR